MIELKQNVLLVLLAIIAFFAPTGEWLLFVGFLVVCDMITGIIAAKRTGIAISSKRMSDTVFKFIAYGIAILISHYVSFIFFPEFPAMQAVSALIASVELKSIDENFEKIFGRSILKFLTNLFKHASNKR